MRGLERFAEPLERLRRRYEDFQRRMAQRRARDDRKKLALEEELPVHQAFVPLPRVLASVAADWKGRESATELTQHLRTALAEGGAFDFEDPTYTAELARRDVLSLFGEGTRDLGRRRSRSGEGFEVFEETDLRNL